MASQCDHCHRESHPRMSVCRPCAKKGAVAAADEDLTDDLQALLETDAEGHALGEEWVSALQAAP